MERRRIALFTTKDDFHTEMFEWENNPYLYFDGVNLPNDVSYLPDGGNYANSINWVRGESTPVDGIIGSAAKFNGNALIWRNWDFPKITRASISLWVKFDPSDLSGWKVLATNRGDGWGDRLFHIATLDGRLNVRAYGSNATSVNELRPVTDTKFQANKWYHVCMVYSGTNLTCLVDGEEWISVYVGNFEFVATERSFTIGDLLGTVVYPFNGIIDEVNFSINENAWTKAQAIEYFETIKYGQFFDNQTEEGSLMLGKGLDGNYPLSTVTWKSPVIDLGGQGQFIDFGEVSAKGIVPSESSSLSFFTRSSTDGGIWEDWIAIAEDGKIQSTNTRYLQIKVEFTTTDPLVTPVLEEIEILEVQLPPPTIELPNVRVLSSDPLYLYRDLESGLDSLGTVRNAYDIMVEEEINGEDILTFKLPKHDDKRAEIGEEPIELIAGIGDRYYVVKEVIDKRDNDGKLYTEFICEARWTELRDWYCDDIEVVGVTAQHALQTIIDSVFYEHGDPRLDWEIGNVEITRRRTLRSEWKDVLSLVRQVQNIWGGEVLFDTENKRIHLLETIGTNSGVRFYYNKNLKNMERIVDTYDLITRIYPQGKGGLDISTVNNGVPYIENRTWVDKLNLRRKIIPYRWKDERYTVPENLLEDAQGLLDDKSKPRIAYITSVHDLSYLSGHEHESFELGDTVTIIDKELFDEEIVNRIVRRRIDVRNPENTEVELSQPIKTLADVRNRAIDEQIESMIESDPLSTDDVQQMTVFNHLLNSRADEGINSDWEKVGTGFDIANTGFSGDWSFKVTPEFNKGNSLTQTVEGVSHRSAYTISAAVATKGRITRGSAEDAFVGIKVVVHYQDGGKPDVHYLAIPDVTEQ